MVQLFDYGYVQPIEFWGDDRRVIEAARMSTNKGFLGWGPKHDESCTLSKPFFGTASEDVCACSPKQGDEKLLKYLWDHKHHTPFEMGGMIVEVKAPIFVARQWFRHRTFSYNEWSARYSELEEEFYTPAIERILAGGQSKSNKQASGEEISPETALQIQHEIRDSSVAAFESYQRMLKAGLSRELARTVLPVNYYTKFRVSGNLRNWLGFCRLRNAEDAQYEIRQYSYTVTGLLGEKFPRTVELFLRSN